MLNNIIRRRQAEGKLRQLSRAVEQSPASIVITDTQGIIEYVNPKFSQLTGYSPEEAIGQNPRVLKSGKTPPETYRQMWETLIAGNEWRGEFVNRKKNGELYYEFAIISPITDANGFVTHYLAVKEDITERKKIEEQIRLANEKLQAQLEEIQSLQENLREQAIRDPLTGLYNRRYLDESLERELSRAARESYPVSFVLIDIDSFKKINDTFGHHAGDQVLLDLAAQFNSQVRSSDIVCRYGGEEFLVVLPNTSVEASFMSAERWRISFQDTRVFNGEQIHITLSMGIATFPIHGMTIDELLVAADGALYAAKAQGRNRVVIWQEHLNESNP